jgi:biopolymer transport protein ExbD
MRISKKETEAEIPTASMADIAFLLIIFFMVTAVFSATKGLEFSLPKDENQPPQAETEEAVFIKVAPDGSLSVDCKPMELDGILDYLEPKLTRDAEKPVILYTDAYAPYQEMISVYDVLGSAEKTRGFKVKNISVPTQSEVSEYIALFGYNPFESQCDG